MKRRQGKQGKRNTAPAAGDGFTPRAGDAVVLDANVLIEYLLEEMMQYPTAKAMAAKRFMDSCCVARHSKQVMDEAMRAAQSRFGIPVPRNAIQHYQNARYGKGKLLPVDEEHLAGIRLPAEVRRIVIEKTREPGKDKPKDGDLHVVRLARAVSARAIITGDDGLKECGKTQAVAAVVRILDAEWILRNVPAPENACP